MDKMHKDLAAQVTQPFDTNTWSLDKILTSLASPNDLKALIQHKISTVPTRFIIPQAIFLKFTYKDTTFFTSFTNTNKFKPAHQKEYELLFTNALNKYKISNKLSITDRDTRDNIHKKLRQKIALNYLTNLDFKLCNSAKIFGVIRYCKGFMKDKTLDNMETLRTLINKAIEEILPELPAKPDHISAEIRDNLPFEIPIKRRSYTRAIVTCLHTIFKFQKLPESYFLNLPPPPENPGDIHPSIQHLFPISNRRALRELSYYKNKLQDFYTITRIPDSYFNLPKPKEPLPLVYQELNPKVRSFFPINTADTNIPLSKIVQELREYYTFTQIPNDFFVPKPKLPTNTIEIKTQTAFSYPIEDNSEAKKFIQETRPYYRFSLPLPTTIMLANPTDKPWLPENAEDLQDFNLTLPINSRKQLQDTARLLRQHYYFRKLPDSWVDLQDLNSNGSKDSSQKQEISNSITEIYNQLQQKEVDISNLVLPITDHEATTKTLTLLREYFTFNNIPPIILNLPPLPEPTWEIFDLE
jgi:hypothetical protein